MTNQLCWSSGLTHYSSICVLCDYQTLRLFPECMFPKCTNPDHVDFPNTIFPNGEWMVPRPLRRTIQDAPFGSWKVSRLHVFFPNACLPNYINPEVSISRLSYPDQGYKQQYPDTLRVWYRSTF